MGLSINTGDLYTVKNTNISWSGFTGTQTSYELQWKLKSSSSWNTCGQVNSSATTVSLLPIYNAAEISGYGFKEIHYRVRVKTTANTNPTNNEVTTGDWYSEAHNLIFRPNYSDSMNIRSGNGIINIPLFNKNELKSGLKLNVKKNNGTVLAAPMVSQNHALKSQLRYDYPDIEQYTVGGQHFYRSYTARDSAAKSTPNFSATNIGRSSYMQVNGSYTYNYNAVNQPAYGYTPAWGYYTIYQYYSFTYYYWSYDQYTGMMYSTQWGWDYTNNKEYYYNLGTPQYSRVYLQSTNSGDHYDTSYYYQKQYYYTYNGTGQATINYQYAYYGA